MHAEIELSGLGLTAAVVLHEHFRVATPKASCDPCAHRTLAVTTVGKRLGLESIGEQVSGHELNRHREILSTIETWSAWIGS
jgi:hypothetical protein